jgi:hypothetical protein
VEVRGDVRRIQFRTPSVYFLEECGMPCPAQDVTVIIIKIVMLSYVRNFPNLRLVKDVDQNMAGVSISINMVMYNTEYLFSCPSMQHIHYAAGC